MILTELAFILIAIVTESLEHLDNKRKEKKKWKNKN